VKAVQLRLHGAPATTNEERDNHLLQGARFEHRWNAVHEVTARLTGGAHERGMGDAPTLRDDKSRQTDLPDGQNPFGFSDDRFGRPAFSLPNRVRVN
jgi:hypothetical protein